MTDTPASLADDLDEVLCAFDKGGSTPAALRLRAFLDGGGILTPGAGVTDGPTAPTPRLDVMEAVEDALRTAHATAGRPVGLDRVLINVEAHVQRPEVAAALRALTDAGRAWTHHSPGLVRTYSPADPHDAP